MGLNGIAVSKALSTVPDLITDENSKNSLTCIQSHSTWVITLSLSGFCPNLTRLRVNGQGSIIEYL